MTESAATTRDLGQGGLTCERRHTTAGVHPFDEVEWELRDAVIGDPAQPAFEQREVEFPRSWSQNATNIVAQKYFRGRLGSPERERSVKQMISRVAGTIAAWGRDGAYFASAEDADAFEAELTHILLHQKAAFNSPVWFNVGWKDNPQASACFILSVDDTMESILDWNSKEGIIFKGGSGSGINLSKVRGSMESLSKGGTASGPVSFMRGADSWAGAIKSGGGTRRAAKMVVLDVDHPDIEDFIWCKAREEQKAAALRDAGFDMRLDSEAFASVQYQNANNSVRVSDEFMQAVEKDEDWQLTARSDGSVIKTVEARELMRQIAEAAWRCADPGIQYDTTINRWHTCPESGRINASNPCFPGDARVHTTAGLITFEELYERASCGEQPRVYTHRATAEQPGNGVVASEPVAIMHNGVEPILRLRFSNGQQLRCTPNHRLWTTNRGYVPAAELTAADRVMLNDAPTPAEDASWELPVSAAMPARASARGGTVTCQALPERWSEGLGELTGHLIGDGDLTDVRAEWVYGGDEIADGVRHFLRTLGVTSARADDKRVPRSVFTAPREVQSAFLRGLFGADGCVSQTDANPYAGLGSCSEALLRDVQRLLSAFGIRCQIHGVHGTSSTDRSRPGFELRITGSDLEPFADTIGFSTPRKQTRLEQLLAELGRSSTKSVATLVACEEDGQEHVYNLTEPLHHSYIVDGFLVANCSEYMHVDDSACNLASLNLMRFRNEDGSFKIADYCHAIDTVFLAQEIIVGCSSYPTSEIDRNANAFRQLGLGYTNLGALLMSNGLPYDSKEGRAVAGAVTALMTGRAYRHSAVIAAAVGPYAEYERNREAHNRVMRMHRDAADELDESFDESLVGAAREVWKEAVALGDEHGYRNAQATVAAPTGTISFYLDADTTGIEPDFSLVKFKELVGGGQMTIVNRTVPMALRTLGYSAPEVEQIEAYVDDHATILGAPGLKDEHLPVFDVAVGERAISHVGHIEMMAAIQPFKSGALSKTVNLPESATVEQIEDAYVRGWRLGLKALAIYRDGSKTAQALRTDAGEKADAEVEATALAPKPVRRKMPRERESLTHKFSIAGHEGYITAGKYEDGSVGEIFLTDIGKEGSTLRGMMNAFATAISLGLQYGVPLEVFVKKFSYMRFDPEGITGNPEIPFAKSMPDYLMRWLASRFVEDLDELEDLGILTPEVRARKEAQLAMFSDDTAAPAGAANGHGNGHASDGGSAEPRAETKHQPGKTVAAAEAMTDTPPVVPARMAGLDLGPACEQCGGMMQRTGSCYTCSSCGNNTGCG